MNELENQLRSLGDAAQANVSPVAVTDITGNTDAAFATDIGVQQDLPRTRHRKPRQSASLAIAAAAVLLVVAAAGVVVLGDSSSDPAVDLASQTHTDSAVIAPANDNGWSKLRFCESSDDYAIDTGNTFYGAYQFTRRTFNDGAQALGFDDFVGTNPAHAPAYIQDAVANAVYLDLGVDAWPICGRYIEGPMITPIVPQWLDETRFNVFASVFVEPGSSDEQVADIAQHITAVMAGDPQASYAFVDKDASFAEFQDMFFDDPLVLESITASAMPVRFDLTATLPARSLETLRDIEGVLSVTTPTQQLAGYTPGPLRISIPAIDLHVPVRLSPTIDHLDQGPVALVDQPDILALAAFGSFSGSAFERLDEVQEGDTVIVSTAVVDGGLSYEIVRTFTIGAGSSSTGPDIRDVDDLLLWRRPHGQGPRLILVADVAGQPGVRLIVRADPVEILQGYATSGD